MRGLQQHVKRRQDLGRIIPARAGFTIWDPRRIRRHGDHPRACGVYNPLADPRCLMQGSSPRVRGLLGCRPRRRHAARIIPARAGFTSGRHSIPMPAGGSSPRVRGLLRRVMRGASCARIIPARAGFTGDPISRTAYRKDHPRACGVYVRGHRVAGGCMGSSPRVRGLLISPEEYLCECGIIPARAGFTCGGAADGAESEDHPRACGVYYGYKVGFSDRARIIPARAGFTPRVYAVKCCFKDHPRACGVYKAVRIIPIIVSGSSPRVRGLQGRGSCESRIEGIIPARAGFTTALGAWKCEGGIIPARAGFTLICAVRAFTVSDHPRACGVYLLLMKLVSGSSGSSPRVRGLPFLVAAHSHDGGIIPARAGFTPTCCYSLYHC